MGRPEIVVKGPGALGRLLQRRVEHLALPALLIGLGRGFHGPRHYSPRRARAVACEGGVTAGLKANEPSRAPPQRPLVLPARRTRLRLFEHARTARRGPAPGPPSTRVVSQAHAPACTGGPERENGYDED